MLSESNRRQGRHDALNLLNAIIGYSHLLQENAAGKGHEWFLPDLNKISLAARQLLAYVENGDGAPGMLITGGPDPGPGTVDAVVGSPAAEATHASAQQRETGSSPPTGGHLLVVDDEATARDILTRRLERQGHTVSTAINGRQALEMVHSNKFDMVLLDIMMPEIDGYQVLAQMKADPVHREIPVIMLSALTDIESVVKCIEMGAEDYLPKPYDQVLLQARIGASLERRRLEISERRQLQEQLRQAQKLESIGRLVGGVAHDFNNMLSVIISYAEMGIRNISPCDAFIEDLRAIMEAAQRSSTLTRPLLAFSRQHKIELKVISLNDMVFETHRMFRRLIGEDIELVIPPPESSSWVEVDPSQIEQVLINLAVNAKDAMPEGGKLTVETCVVSLAETEVRRGVELPAGPYVLLTVTDSGVGMDEATKARIFEPFFTTKEEGKGTGLGLATCDSIIKENHGLIEVVSQLGSGTTFKIFLPHVDEPPESEIGTETFGVLPGGAESILVVEDEPSLLRAAVSVLTRQGYTVSSAANGEEALKMARNYTGEKLDLLLTDIVMPQMGGKELAEEVGSILPETKVLYMSGYTDGTDASQMGLNGDYNFLEKPFSTSGLACRVREVLDK